MTSEKYLDLVDKIHTLVITEIQKYTYTAKDPFEAYPKLVIMYEFFRLLRGEAFLDSRPHALNSNDQKKFYEMEDEIRKSLDEVKNKVDFQDERVQEYIRQILTPYLLPNKKIPS